MLQPLFGEWSPVGAASPFVYLAVGEIGHILGHSAVIADALLDDFELLFGFQHPGRVLRVVLGRAALHWLTPGPIVDQQVSTQVVIQRERKRFVNGNQMRKWDTAGHEKRERV